MSIRTPRVISVRQGRVHPSGSWLYVWLDVSTGAIASVGGTRFDPELRVYLHVMSDDPEVGRVRAAVPRYDKRDFDVLAFELPEGVDRAVAKEALAASLAGIGEDPVVGTEGGDVHEIIGPIVEAIASYRGSISRETPGS